MTNDGSRHSPSVSSERSDRSSIVVPPRTKKVNHNNVALTLATVATTTTTITNQVNTPISPPTPPTGGGPCPVGRAPLPPPRKSNQRLVCGPHKTPLSLQMLQFKSRPRIFVCLP